MKKYLVIDERERDIFTTVCDTLEAANREAESQLDGLTYKEQKTAHIYVLDVKSEDLDEPGNWCSFTAGGFCDGRFDSHRWYAVIHRDDEYPDHGDGSWSLEEATEQAREEGGYIAAVDPRTDYCIEEIEVGVSLADAYDTYEDGRLINQVDFESKVYTSVAEAYKICIEHGVDCLKAGDAEITDIDDNRIYYTVDGLERVDEVRLYDGAGRLVPYEEVE